MEPIDSLTENYLLEKLVIEKCVEVLSLVREVIPSDYAPTYFDKAMVEANRNRSSILIAHRCLVDWLRLVVLPSCI